MSRKATQMDRDEAKAALQGVADAMTEQHGGQADRLHQLTSHLATASMAVDHLFDQAENGEQG